MAYDELSGFDLYECYDSNTKTTTRYEGTFMENYYDGWGKLYTNDELEYIGYWSDGYKEGAGTLYYTNDSGKKRMYKGEFLHGQCHGYGEIYDENDNLISKGQFEEGKLVEDMEQEIDQGTD